MPADEQKRPYKRTAPKVHKIGVTGYQADVLYAAVTREVNNVQANREMPTSLKTLAIEQLSAVVDQLREIVNSEED